MATAVKFYNFYPDLGAEYHDFANDTIKVLLSNSAPAPSTDDTSADISEITAGNGYTAGGETLTVTAWQGDGSGGVELVISDKTVTASGGSIGPFRYAIIYNATSDRLMWYYDRGSELTLSDGDSVDVDFTDASQIAFSIA